MDNNTEEGLTITPDAPKDSLEGQTDTNSPSNQPSVIQSTQPIVQISKNSAILLNKAGSGSVIQSTPNSSVQSIQVIEADALPPQYEDEAARRRREILTRRPSYRKILNDLGGGEISEDKGDGDVDGQGAAYQGNGIIKVIPANTIQISCADGVQGLQTLSMSSAGAAANTIVQYTQGDGQFFVPVSIPVTGGLKLDQGGSQHMVLTSSGEVVEEVTKKREVRLYKNREAARECRRKKKEYIKCLENRVAVLENQNKALIEELKSLKELYCQKKLP
ncbi:cyclic AMP-responsive element-binding protein 1-like isoform X2 [Pollicipes pollicipes]|uniref:cyclic AMP-responsive element-binding protein 1-like isoform X2 n=1 Tax=Pollicipes pollicipes TaxID=41117 RepID=UPI0018858619|nr:cyclic AMP-responsive element-binding protein 1-like isoform X2 [Pollicipes pollicipes]XP_037074899.1 cyclic AMP-responsive element-binding protein 1-like isoform X2 [Pollicipes pollicipes]